MPCIMPMFPVDGLLIVETFTRRALPLFIANRCGVPVPITRDEAIRTPLVTLVVRTRVLRCAFPQEPLIVARLITCLPLCASMPSETLGTLRAWPAPDLRGSAHTQNSSFSGLCVGFRAYTLHLVALAYLSPRLSPRSQFTSERPTTPYSGELAAVAVL